MHREVLDYYKGRMGFAGENGGTTGGAGGPVVRVTTGDELVSAINGPTPVIIEIAENAVINGANTKPSSIDMKDRKNISLIGLTGSFFEDVGIRLVGKTSNIWIRGLTISKVKEGPKDCIGIEGEVRNVMIESNDLSGDHAQGNKDLYDGLIDVKRGAEYITITENYLHNHHKACLFGHSDSDTGLQNWFVTFARNFVEDIGSRGPSVRDGFCHVVNNYYRHVTTSCVNTRMDAEVLIEGNVFEDVDDPIASMDSKKVGRANIGENEYINVTWTHKPGKSEALFKDLKSTSSWRPEYDLPLLPLSEVRGYCVSLAGPKSGTVVTPPTTEEPPVVTQPEQPQPETNAGLVMLNAAIASVEASLAALRRAAEALAESK